MPSLLISLPVIITGNLNFRPSTMAT
jgi:hypothetical protein